MRKSNPNRQPKRENASRSYKLFHSRLSHKKSPQEDLKYTSLDAATVFSMVATAATIFLTFCTLIGYAFLVRYYEIFGIRYSDILIGTEHLFLRGFDLILQNFQMFFLFALVLSCAAFMPVLYSFRSIKSGLGILFLLILGISASVSAIHYCAQLARDYSNRDMFSSTTTLRQLFCLHSEKAGIVSVLASLAKKDRKVLVLAKSANQLIFFSEPPIVAENPSVTVAILELSDGDLVQTKTASVGVIGNNGTFICPG